MKVQTKFYGEVEVETTDCLEFVTPLLGFESQTKFALIPALEEVSPFSVMQSLEDVNLAFYVIDPFVIEPDYEFDLTPEQVACLGVESADDVKVLTLVTIDQCVQNMTTSLVAPIVIHQETQQAMQIVLHQTAYTTKHPILKDKGCSEEC